MNYKKAFFILLALVSVSLLAATMAIKSGRVITCFESTDVPLRGERLTVYTCDAPVDSVVKSNLLGKWQYFVIPDSLK